MNIDNNQFILIKIPTFGDGFISFENVEIIEILINEKPYPSLSFVFIDWILVEIPVNPDFHLNSAFD